MLKISLFTFQNRNSIAVLSTNTGTLVLFVLDVSLTMILYKLGESIRPRGILVGISRKLVRICSILTHAECCYLISKIKLVSLRNLYLISLVC